MRACWLKWVGWDWSISADNIWLIFFDANIVTNSPQHMHPTFRKNIKQDEVRLYEAVR